MPTRSLALLALVVLSSGAPSGASAQPAARRDIVLRLSGLDAYVGHELWIRIGAAGDESEDARQSIRIERGAFEVTVRGAMRGGVYGTHVAAYIDIDGDGCSPGTDRAAYVFVSNPAPMDDATRRVTRAIASSEWHVATAEDCAAAR